MGGGGGGGGAMNGAQISGSGRRIRLSKAWAILFMITQLVSPYSTPLEPR